jgi:hypothetical protein
MAPRQPADLHEWVSFEDPDGEDRTWVFDLTFLTSPWTCIFGRGCQGVLTEPAGSLVQGCCSYGAHLQDDADRRNLRRHARRLTAEQWQHRPSSPREPLTAVNADGEELTRLVDDACIFLNRPGWASGAGCALHQWGMRTGTHHSVLKPEVCWQLPLRRIDEEQDDGTVVSRLTEFGREGWGEGGDDFAWWCTEAPEAFVNARPVYRSLESELRIMLGDRLYRRVARYLDERIAARPAPVVHPAEVRLLAKRPDRRTRR